MILHRMATAGAWRLLEDLDEGVLVLEPDGALAYANGAARERLGLEELPNSLGAICALAAPGEPWAHLLAAPAEAAMLLPGGPTRVRSQAINIADREYVRLTLGPTPWEVGNGSGPDDRKLQHSLAALTRVVQKLNDTLRLEDILLVVLQEALGICLAEGGAVFRWDPELGIRTKPLVAIGLAPATPAGRTTQERLLASRGAVLLPPLAPDGTTVQTLGVAIRYAGEPVAVLCVSTHAPHGFAPEAPGFLATVADYAAIAFGNSVRFDEVQLRSALLSRRAEQMERFVESSRLFHRHASLPDVMEDLVYAIQEAVGYEVVLLSLIEENDPAYHLHRVAAAGLPLDRMRELQAMPQPWSAVRRLTHDRFALGQAYFVPAEANIDRGTLRPTSRTGLLTDLLEPAQEPDRWHPRDLFFIVIRGSNREPLGIISLDVPRDGRRPDRNAARALELFANQAAIAVENLRLYRNTREYANQLQRIHDVSQQVLRERSFAGKLAHLVGGLQQIGWGHVTLSLRDERLEPVQVISAGVPEPEGPFPTFGVENGAIWRARLADDDFLRFRVGTAFFLPAEDPWARQNLASGRGDTATLRPLAADWQPEDLFLFPLRDQNAQIVALVRLDRPTNGQRPDARSLQIIELYARFAASVIENARLFEETSRRERYSAALGRVGAAISATFDLPTVLALICQESCDIFGVDGAYIWRRRDSALRGVAARGAGEAAFLSASVPLEAENVFAAMIARGGAGRFVNGVEPTMGIDFGLPAADGIRAALGVPLDQDGENAGVLVLVDRDDPYHFTPDDVELATRFGVQAAIAIRNATLVTELRELNEQLDARVAERTQALGEERDRMQLLLRITTELAASLDEHFVLNRALALINEVAHAHRGGILMIEPEDGGMICRAAFGSDAAIPREGLRLAQRPDEGLPGWVIGQRRPAMVTDAARDERWLPAERAGAARAALVVPLHFGEDIVGVLELFHDEPGAFSAEQLELVQAAASQVSNALYNAQLYVLIREQTEKLGKMWREEQIEAAKSGAILESIADGVLFADAAGTITLANQATSAVLGLPREQLEGRPVRELRGLYGASGDAWIQAIDSWAASPTVVGKGTVLSDQLTLDDRFVAVSLAPVLDRGQFIGAVSIFRDITQAVEVDRMKSEFVSTVSHELRTPMTSIKGYADLILMGVAGPLDEQLARFVEVIRTNADRLSLLVNDLLDISRFETGKARLHLGPVDLSGLIEAVVGGHGRGRVEHEKRRLELHAEIPAILPPVRADDARVTQVLTNLVDNAINYTPDGGTITVRAAAVDGTVRVSVADTGIGIPAEAQQKIFDRFYRSDDTQVQQVAGTGLGLAIVKTLVDMHGGELTLESALGRGSTFAFSLPLYQADDGPDERVPAAAQE